MKTKTTIIDDNPKIKVHQVKMVDANYRVSIEIGYTESLVIVNALRAYAEQFQGFTREAIAADGNNSQAIAALHSMVATAEKTAKAFDVQRLIENKNLNLIKSFNQES